MDPMTPEQQALIVRRWRRARRAMAVVLAVVTWPVALVVTLVMGSAMLDLSQPAALDRALDQIMAFIDGSLLRHTLAVEYEPMQGSPTLQLTPYEFGEVSDRVTLRREMLKAMDIYRLAFN